MTTWTSEQHGAVAVLTFARPPQNMMDFASMIELGDLLEDAASRPDEIRIIMITGGIDDVFIFHADLADLARGGAGHATAEENAAWGRALRLLQDIPQPTLAAINGAAWGGGNEIALACTLRIGSEHANFAAPEVNIGIIPGGGGSVRLPRLIGPGLAADVVITGRVIDAHEALRSGWITALLPADDFHRHAIAWATNAARNPAPALNAAKRSLVEGGELSLEDALALEKQLFDQLTASSAELTGD
jgi:enoyl-CoA hydratase